MILKKFILLFFCFLLNCFASKIEEMSKKCQDLEIYPVINKRAGLFISLFEEKDFLQKLESSASWQDNLKGIDEILEADFFANFNEKDSYISEITSSEFNHQNISAKVLDIFQKLLTQYDKYFYKDLEFLNNKKNEILEIFNKLSDDQIFIFKRFSRFFDSKSRLNFKLFICKNHKVNRNEVISFGGKNIFVKVSDTSKNDEIISKIIKVVVQSFWNNMSENKIKEFSKIFNEKQNRFTNVGLCEILATVIAGIFNSSDKFENFTENKQVAKIATKIAPEIKIYLKSRWKIDDKLIKKILNLIEKYYPNLKDEKASIFSEVSITLFEGADVLYIKKFLFENFKTKKILIQNELSKTSIFIDSEIWHPKLKEVLKDEKIEGEIALAKYQQECYLVVILTKEHEKIKKALAELSKIKNITKEKFFKKL